MLKMQIKSSFCTKLELLTINIMSSLIFIINIISAACLCITQRLLQPKILRFCCYNNKNKQ